MIIKDKANPFVCTGGGEGAYALSSTNVNWFFFLFFTDTIHYILFFLYWHDFFHTTIWASPFPFSYVFIILFIYLGVTFFNYFLSNTTNFFFFLSPTTNLFLAKQVPPPPSKYWSTPSPNGQSHLKSDIGAIVFYSSKGQDTSTISCE